MSPAWRLAVSVLPSPTWSSQTFESAATGPQGGGGVFVMCFIVVVVVCVCMCACVFVYMCVCVNVCVSVCIHTHIQARRQPCVLFFRSHHLVLGDTLSHWPETHRSGLPVSLRALACWRWDYRHVPPPLGLHGMFGG